MANYIAKFRTNYIRVKDDAAFLAWVRSIEGLEAQRHDNVTERISYALFCNGSEPQFTTDGHDVDIADEIASHLDEEEVAVLMETGHENQRYLVGTAQAIAWDGRKLCVSLSDIYAKAEDALVSTCHAPHIETLP